MSPTTQKREARPHRLPTAPRTKAKNPRRRMKRSPRLTVRKRRKKRRRILAEVRLDHGLVLPSQPALLGHFGAIASWEPVFMPIPYLQLTKKPAKMQGKASFSQWRDIR